MEYRSGVRSRRSEDRSRCGRLGLRLPVRVAAGRLILTARRLIEHGRYRIGHPSKVVRTHGGTVERIVFGLPQFPDYRLLWGSS